MELPPFQMLLRAHHHDVYRFLAAAVGRQDADDCFQETFLSALRAYPRLRDGSNLRGWLFTIAHRKAMDWHRARLRRPHAANPAPEATHQPPGSEGEIGEEVRRLPARQRAAVLHRYVNDFSYREIGRILGCSEAAARQSVHEGLKKLRRTWPR
jgi:RNA polymerase sigma factor (sigma-70 family)